VTLKVLTFTFTLRARISPYQNQNEVLTVIFNKNKESVPKTVPYKKEKVNLNG